jgi:CRP/FNR family transcriptional regulator, anaerobic regulatory protein
MSPHILSVSCTRTPGTPVLTLVEPHIAISGRETAEAVEPAGETSDCEVLTLRPGETLFREGDTRSHVYRVEQGALCLFKSRADGTQDIFEFAFPGDLVGLGYLDSHVSGAQAAVATSLICLSRTALDPSAERNARSRARLTAAIEREVTFLRESLLRSGHPNPLERVAALFVTLSRFNAYEGREPTMITDSLKCGVVAGYLNMSVDELAAQLSEMEARGLIEPCAKGLRLKDLDGLEKIADRPL